MILTRNAIAMLVASTLALAHAALAQTPPPAGADAAATPAAAQPAAAPVLRSDAKAHADADARACLDFVSNVGVIRCAEKYLPHPGKRANPNG